MDTRILFVCRDGVCRCRMAAAFASERLGPDVDISHAGTAPAAEPDALAGAVLADVGVKIAGGGGVPLSSLSGKSFDVIVEMSENGRSECPPLLPGRPMQIHWNLPDPSDFAADPETRRAAYVDLRERIRRRIDTLIDHGYFEALVCSKQTENLVIESVSDGIMAHDMQRRIVYVNRAAELMTGVSREDVLGKDCHSVFDGNLCRGKCLFCDLPVKEFEEQSRRIELYTLEGDKLLVDTRLKPLRDAKNRMVGVVLSFRDLTREHELARRIGEIQNFEGIIGRDAKMQSVYELVRDVADANIPVVIYGESGTGKELVAAAIHNESQRARRLFVPVNCGALPEGLLESELFGHVKGAFTGAIRDKKGRFELADGGTIFLDEIGDISPAMQVRLLRVLQEGVFERVGSERSIRVDVRLISATHRDLGKEIEAGRFREDLFYRLNVVPIRLPPLRERRNDIPLLANHFLESFAAEMGRENMRFSENAIAALIDYDWPGNVRELQNWIRFALIKCRVTTIEPEHLPIMRDGANGSRPANGVGVRSVPRGRRGLTVEGVHNALQRCGGNRVEAARWLGVSRATLYRYFREHPESF